MTIPGSLEVPLILHWYRRCPDNQCVFRPHLNKGRGSTSTGQGPATLLLAAPTAARHGHHGTFWTGHWFSWLGDKDLGSMRSCIHHLVTCHVGCDKTNSSSSMQLTTDPNRGTTCWAIQVNCAGWHPCLKPALIASWCCIQSNWGGRIESRLLYGIFEDSHLRNRTQTSNCFIIYECSWAGRTALSLKGGTLTWSQVSPSNLLTNLLVQVCGIKNIKPLCYSLLLKVNKYSQLHSIITISLTEQLTGDTMRLTS